MSIQERIQNATKLKNEDKVEEALKEYLDILSTKEIDNKENYKFLSYCLFQVAVIYRIYKNYDEVVWYCQELIKNNYGYKEPYLLMAEVYNDMKMPTLAIGCILAADKYGIIEDTLDDNDCETIKNDILSLAYGMLGELDKALEYNDKVLETNEDNLQALKNQRILLKEKKRDN